MTLHFHGTPITPRRELETLAGRSFCVSFAAPQDVARCHQIGQAVMLDNGAFSAWRAGKATDWPGYYKWTDEWLDHPTTWAVIPDVIEGAEAANDKLMAQWPHGTRQGWAVWHLHESLHRLQKIVYGRGQVCFGSSAEFAVVGSPAWRRRIEQALEAIHSHRPRIHMLRGMAALRFGYPFYSVDSTDAARNHNRPQNTALEMVERWDAIQAAPWRDRNHRQPDLGLEIV